jgi:hypothetical protein
MRRKCGKPPKLLGFSRPAIVAVFLQGRSVGMAMNGMTPIITNLSLAICVVTVTV